jgi:hypothetical protein
VNAKQEFAVRSVHFTTSPWRLLVVAAMVAGAGYASAEPRERSVRVLYLVPKDKEPRKDYQAAIESAVLDLQVWYYGHMNGRTFRVNDPVVEVKRTDHEAAWYDRNEPANRPEAKYRTFYNALADAGTLLGAKADDPRFVWLVYIDAPGGTGAGMPSVAVLPQHDLEGLIGRSSDRTPISRWIGGCGHELGHGFGLPHPGDPHRQAIMEVGYANYPACYLTPQDTRTLGGSPFFHAEMPLRLRSKQRRIYLYQGGCFVWTGGANWEERKTGTATLYRFVARKEDESYWHLLDDSRKPGAWIGLPKEGKGNDIFFSWHGEPWRKIYVAE